jgi:DNA-binding response OmpR family regulator
MQILLVEDDPLARQGIQKVLEHAGFSIVIAPNGLAAFSELRRGSFAAIVCDLRLPFLRGEDFFTQVKELSPAMAGRVVFVTGLGNDPEAVTFLKETGQPYLLKPFEADELVAAVRKVAVAE